MRAALQAKGSCFDPPRIIYPTHLLAAKGMNYMRHLEEERQSEYLLQDVSCCIPLKQQQRKSLSCRPTSASYSLETNCFWIFVVEGNAMEKMPELYCARAVHIFGTGSTVLGPQRGKVVVQDECREVIPSPKNTPPPIHNDLDLQLFHSAIMIYCAYHMVFM